MLSKYRVYNSLAEFMAGAELQLLELNKERLAVTYKDRKILTLDEVELFRHKEDHYWVVRSVSRVGGGLFFTYYAIVNTDNPDFMIFRSKDNRQYMYLHSEIDNY